MSDTKINFPLPSFEQEVVYKECNRNHAASQNLVCQDGCQEFLKAGDENNTADAMLCVVCGCHRNFHVPVRVFVPLKRKKRTTFAPDLKSKMRGFAERIGWTPKGANKEDIDNFCLENGINRKIFSLWLNNNRPRAMKKNRKIEN